MKLCLSHYSGKSNTLIIFPVIRLEVGDMITLLKTNFVVASILAKDLQDRALQFEFTLHPHFPVVKLV